uniref:hypothetical protein n=1 Tax=Thaumasiovibrio occultus TaxID=1891184 RepID=UPI000B363B4F|nr:hypothetical protein [Thaumasiovibrio occultus]
MLKIKLTRDSVSMGDDCAAPHALNMALPVAATLQQLADAIASRAYLARVAGCDHSWLLLVNGQQVATLRANRMTVAENGGARLIDLALNGVVRVHFQYISSSQE